MTVNDKLHTLAALSLEKEPQYRMDIGLDSPKSRYGISGEDKHAYCCRESNIESLEVRYIV
jgi:hypothetical protein